MAAAGAWVTVFDNSPRQLDQDEFVATRDDPTLRTVLGGMRDLGAFAGQSFDVILNPVSNTLCPDLAPVWLECSRDTREEVDPSCPMLVVAGDLRHYRVAAPGCAY